MTGQEILRALINDADVLLHPILAYRTRQWYDGVTAAQKRIAVAVLGNRFTQNDVWARVHRMASLMARRGVEPDGVGSIGTVVGWALQELEAEEYGVAESLY